VKYNPDEHHRHSIRLKGYDYAQAGGYFVTICTHERACRLGQVENGLMCLSDEGRLVEECWRDLPRYFPQVELDAFVVMPNHVHGIVIITDIPRDVGAKHFSGRSGNVQKNASPLRTARTARTSQTAHPHGTQHGSLGAIVQNFKSISTRKVNQLHGGRGVPLWQRNYYEHIIRDERSLEMIRQYIVENPSHWTDDENHPDNIIVRRQT
jgi:REP element-mobilizing transposase RayT